MQLIDLKKLNIVKLNVLEQEVLKTNLLNLPKEDITDYLRYIIDEQYKEYKNTDENLLIENFLIDERLVEYYKMIKQEDDKEIQKLTISLINPN